MGLTLRESQVIGEIAGVLYDFLPGSGRREWKAHVSFESVAAQLRLGAFWPGGSKQPAIAALLSQTMERRPTQFEELVVSVVRAGDLYRRKEKRPIRREEITKLNELLLRIGRQFPELRDPGFLNGLDSGSSPAAKPTGDEADQAAESARRQSIAEFDRDLGSLRDRFFALAGWTDRQAAGIALEGILNELFSLSGLEPLAPFRVTGEQIDGSFELDAATYLVEAKWEKKPLSEAPLLVFHGKVEAKSQITRGVFFAMNGITGEAEQAYTRGRRPSFFVVNGDDLTHVLYRQIELQDLLRKKRRRLADKGALFVSVRELI